MPEPDSDNPFNNNVGLGGVMTSGYLTQWPPAAHQHDYKPYPSNFVGGNPELAVLYCGCGSVIKVVPKSVE